MRFCLALLALSAHLLLCQALSANFATLSSSLLYDQIALKNVATQLRQLRSTRPVTSQTMWRKLGESNELPMNVTRMRELVGQADRDLLTKLLQQMQKSHRSRNSLNLLGLDVQSERLQSFTPDCSSSIVSSNDFSIILPFSIQFPTDKVSGSKFVIGQANLLLYKIAAKNGQTGLYKIMLFEQLHSDASSSNNKHLIDSKEVEANFEGWVEFNALSVVSLWHRSQTQNHNLLIEIIDQTGKKISASPYISPMNCSDGRASLPNLLALQPELAASMNMSSLNRHYPTLDILSLLLSEQDAQTFHLEQDQQRNLYGILNEQTLNRRSKRSIYKEVFVYRPLLQKYLQDMFYKGQGRQPILKASTENCQIYSEEIEMPKQLLKSKILYPRRLRVSICMSKNGFTNSCKASKMEDVQMTIKDGKSLNSRTITLNNMLILECTEKGNLDPHLSTLE